MFNLINVLFDNRVILKMQKKTRTDLESVKPILEEYYQKGLTGLQTAEQKNMADDLCLKTSLTHKQVKVRNVCLLNCNSSE
jgi:hypothetical protein